MTNQLSFLAEERPYPDGLAYQPDLISAGEEAGLVGRIRELAFAPFEFHGFEGKRRTISFGLQYEFDGSGLREAEAIPDFLLPVRAEAARFAGLEPDALQHVLVIEYSPGSGIGWHRDRPVFGDVVGISLQAPAPLRFRRKVDQKWQRFTQLAQPRSAYLLTGPARTEWEHSILPMDALRYSITFRTLRG